MEQQLAVSKFFKKVVGTLVVMSLMVQAVPTFAVESLLNLPKISEIRKPDNVSIEQLIKSLPKDVKSTDKHLLLINKENRLTEEPYVELVYGNYGDFPYSVEIDDALTEMFEAGAREGYFYYLVSGYRSMSEQAANIEGRIGSYLSAGYSQEEAEYMTNLFVAPFDATEHASGLAVDILANDWAAFDLDVSYAYTDSANWLAENAHKFGFVLRYMEGKDDITGYHYEPWHFRYVGVESATYMHQYELTLEEYLALLQERETKSE